MALNVQSLPGGGRVRRRQVGSHLSEINVTPFIDVMLVLLIIFMVTAPMMQSGIGIDLPEAETETAPAEEGLFLTVSADRYIHMTTPAGESVVNINLLEQRLREHFYGQAKKIVYIRGDQSLPYGYIVQIMDAAHKAGVEAFNLVTEQPEDRKK